ncbi:hypothetical protein FRC07_007167, partial [Ceratobasidium sp. 392]
MVRWLRNLVGENTLDERLTAMPLAQGLQHFEKGVTGISQWTGCKSKQLAAQILHVLAGTLSANLTDMVRSLLDFMFRSHAASLSKMDLTAMERDLARFHELKGLLIAKGIYKSDAWFDRIPKLHMLSHYTYMIQQMGTPDGYNTEVPENLHIDLDDDGEDVGDDGKDGKDGKEIEVEEPVDIVELRDIDAENDARYTAAGSYGVQVVDGGLPEALPDAPEPVSYPHPRRQMAKCPTRPNEPICDIVSRYGASDLISATISFLERRLKIPPHHILISPHNCINVWHKLYLHHEPLAFAPFDARRRDVVWAALQGRAGRYRHARPATWDVALYAEKPNRFRSGGQVYKKHGIQRYCAGRVRALFTLPAHLTYMFSGLLAYVEVFAPFEASVSPFAGMHWTKHEYDARGRRRTLVIPISDIPLACHLTPKFHLLDEGVKLTTRMDLFAISKFFWLNHYYNHYFYRLIQHWQQRRPRMQDRLLRHIR